MVQVVSQAPSSRMNSTQTTSNKPRAPVWKTVLKVAIIVVAIAAAIYIGKTYVIPKVVQLIGAIGSAAASTIEVVTTGAEAVKNTADSASKTIKFIDHIANKPLIVDFVKGVDTIVEKVDKFTMVETKDGLKVNTGGVGLMSQFITGNYLILKNLVNSNKPGSTGTNRAW